ncbi:MAG: chromosome segregation protein SMC [Proteobacteria bacterium]|nr:chromosome segregation protein SMC [Desulfobacteraceae bacterium]MBU3980244.1 chromosome segregation protein SMC [Pseudomonadota bacterium]MBU4014543.1 chromosome segregation protein SMC [Pseudomonadota bacterium]MBU4068371.1 chromosome segregation protein SMC [Pseudomonadota bacterium]MBU4101161.1 chromosome segregation protein SMC [Pseudomonadota bacterium]
MKLKKLEVTGFKSFSEKSSIEFPAGISAVVGPNGCGKSNIVDALRWVMGEQSVKQLRGKAMEDVIFSGSNGNLPLNMAEVCLTLLNDNGTAPEELKDFTEIMLTRRLYRSGESGYFINKQPCRLKDVHNIFLGSGLGTKSYSIIQQGNIGAITEAGPEERRFFIEEAAGITRYKNRKKEALSKVDATRQNLLRINDILNEVKKQLAGLKRQVKKAEIYNNYQKGIRELDILISLANSDNYSHQIRQTESLLKDLNDTHIEHTSKIKKLDAAVEDIKFQLSQKEHEISEQKSQKFEIHRNIDRIENDLKHLRREMENLSSEAIRLEAARKEIEEKNNNIITEITQIETQNAKLKDNITDVESSLEQERSASQKIRDQMSELTKRLEDYKTHLMELVAKEARYKNIYQNAASNKENIKRRLKIIDEEEVRAKNKLKETQKYSIKAQKHLKELKLEIDDLNQSIEIKEEELDRKSKELGKKVKFIQIIELEKNKLKSKFNALKKMADNFEWYKDGVRAIMKKYVNKETTNSSLENNGILGLMADIIEPEASFETAVEAALGESLQYILVNDQKTGLDAIAYLQSNSAGRSGFIPVSSIKKIKYNLSENSNTQKNLLKHIAVKPGFEKIAESFLENVIVTTNIEEAIKINKSNDNCWTIVTKNGDIISPQGIVIGGSKDNLSGILAKKQELKELEGQINRINKKIESTSLDKKELESEVRVIESDLQKLIENKNKTTQDRIEAEKRLYKTSEDEKYAQKHLEIVSLEQEHLMGEEIDIDEEMVRYNRELAEITNEVETAQHKVAETSERISSASDEMENFNQRIMDLKLRLTAINAGIENNYNTLKRLEEFKDEGINQFEQLCGEINKKHQNRTNSEQKIQEYEKNLPVMYNDMTHLEQELERNEADYHAIDDSLKENDNIITKIQDEREKTLQKIRLLEIERSQRHIKLENIANYLEATYRIPLSDLRSELRDKAEKQDMPIDEMEVELSRLKEKIANISDVNLGAIKEYKQLKERLDFLSKQYDDLVQALDDLHKVIKKINHITQEKFIKTFDLVNEKLNEVFPRLFDGGTAQLVLTEPAKPLETGVEFMIHPPGKKLTRMSLLSGGEKALSAIAFIFSIFLIKPASFCIMDEIDASLDEANIFRFNNLLKIIGEKSQIIMITHNKKSMEFAGTLFGITMEKKGISKIVSVNLG